MGEYTIIWRKKARQQYIEHLEYAQAEFGNKAFYGWINAVAEMEKHLRQNPRHYSVERLLPSDFKEYRGCTVMKNFKFIYSFDDIHKTVYVETLWDMRMNPRKLQKLLG